MEKRGTNMAKPLKPQVVAYTVNKLLADDAVIASDCGTVTSWSARYLHMREKMLFTASGLLATMGNGVPYAVAAAAAFPGRQVVAMVGDGGFTMMMMEMATLVKYKLPVKVIVFKNNTLGQIKWEQMVFEGNPEFGVDLQPIDFAAYARACGAGGFTVDDPAKVESVLREAFAYPGPALVRRWWTPTNRRCPATSRCRRPGNSPSRCSAARRTALPIIADVIKDKIREVL